MDIFVLNVAAILTFICKSMTLIHRNQFEYIYHCMIFIAWTQIFPISPRMSNNILIQKIYKSISNDSHVDERVKEGEPS